MKIPSIKRALLLAAVAIAALACEWRGTVLPEEDAGTDAGEDTGSETDTHSDTWVDTDWGYEFWDWSCTSAGAEPCVDGAWDFPSAYELFTEAADHGLTFIHASHSPGAILAEREIDDAFEPVVMVQKDGFSTLGLLDPPAEPLRALDIVSKYHLDFHDVASLIANELIFGYAAIALLCGESSCALYGLAIDDSGQPLGLEPVTGGAVPLPDARALDVLPAVFPSDPPPRVCVAGDGIACFDGDTWTGEVPPGGAVLRDLFADSGYLVAAGDAGRVVTDRGGAWHEIDLGAAMNFVSVGAYDGVIAAAGVGGFAFGDGEHAVACESKIPSTAVLVRAKPFADQPSVLLTVLSEDRVLEIWGDKTALQSCSREMEFSGAPRDAGYMPGCADVVCGYALAPGGLYWRSECATGPE